MSVRVVIVGASGFAGSEIARILVNHPEVDIIALMAGKSAGTRFGEVNPNVPALANRIVESTNIAVLKSADVVFVALPHGESAKLTAQLVGGPIIIDCGADHRLTSQEAWRRYYGGEYPGAWAYGMPELIHAQEYEQISAGQASRAFLSRKLIKTAREIAVPGCNVTAVTLAIQPAVAANLVDTKRITATLAVGYSGAGRSPKPHLLATAALANLAPYSAVGKHRHIPEIIQNLQVAGAREVAVDFTPVLTPTSRGIVAVVNAQLNTCQDAASQLCHAYENAYANETLVDVIDTYPQTQPILGTGRATVWAGVDDIAGSVTAIAAIDNLGKGTACAAVQSMNLACGFDEALSIPTIGVAP
ncbi:MAG: N-acetyl-gamma-glutamyl-phosphate reductase [Actinomycetaceae bacterium]|nr:N-acetyl-gamma-glutamyl-phosphate reductase [Actinomycetaceae bacterium]